MSENHSPTVIVEALPAGAPAIAAIHLAARREAMPYLAHSHTEEETKGYFARAVGDRLQAWWVVHDLGQVVAYMLIDGEDLDHLYVAPTCQGRGFGSALLAKAKTLSPSRLELRTFRRNQRARAFYEARDFRAIGQTEGANEGRLCS